MQKGARSGNYPENHHRYEEADRGRRLALHWCVPGLRLVP